jgi:hypothetical protein
MKVLLDLKPKPALGFTSAADPVLLPEAEPRAVRKHFVVLSIRGHEVARAQRPTVRLCEDALKALYFGNGLLSVHYPFNIQHWHGSRQSEWQADRPERRARTED